MLAILALILLFVLVITYVCRDDRFDDDEEE